MPNTHERCSNHVRFVDLFFRCWWISLVVWCCWILLLLIVVPSSENQFLFLYSNKRFFLPFPSQMKIACPVIRLTIVVFSFIEIHCQRQSPAVFCRPSWEYSVILMPSNNVFQFQMEWRNGYSITNMLVLKIFLHLTNDGNCMLNDDQQRKHDKRNKTIKIISLK